MRILKHKFMEQAGDGSGGAGAGAGAGSGTGAGDAGAGAGAGAAAPWYGTFSDADLRTYVETKGFPKDGKGIEALANSYRNLEKHFGVPADQLLKLPKDDTDKETWNKIYDRLGRPAKAEEYELPTPEGDNGEYAKFISTAMHELGLTKKQAQALAAKQNEFVAQMTTKEAEAYAATIKEQDTALHTEWGVAYDKNVQIARGAFAELGISTDAVNALEKAIGFAGVMKMFHGIGSKIGEDKFVSGDGVEGFSGVMSPAAAQQRIDAIKADPVLRQKYISGDAALKKEMDNLHKILAYRA